MVTNGSLVRHGKLILTTAVGILVLQANQTVADDSKKKQQERTQELEKQQIIILVVVFFFLFILISACQFLGWKDRLLRYLKPRPKRTKQPKQELSSASRVTLNPNLV